MKTVKKLTAVLLALLFVFSPLAGVPFELPAFAATSGTTGDCTWSLSGTTLTISGNGDMGSYGLIGHYNYITAPWGTSITKVIIEDGVTSIGNEAFSECRSLTSISIPNSVTSIGRSAFKYCTSLASLTIPDGVTFISGETFLGCISLSSITVAEGNPVYHSSGNCIIKTASKNLVLGCKNSVIPTDGSVTSIGSSAFSYCKSLTSITIPESVTSIGSSAFSPCDSLTDVWYEGNELDRAKISIGDYNADLTNATWHYNFCADNPAQEKVHVYDNGCDTDCNVCGKDRTPPHDYTVQDKDETNHWMKCCVCGTVDEATRETHGYDNNCDTTCDDCGHVRTITHDYSAQDKSETEHWMKCSVCGVIDEPTRETHIYDNACDNNCNGCGFVREITHNYSIQDKDATNHWMKCSVCGAVDETTVTVHIYDNACDVDCNVCGQVRTITHDYSVQDKDATNHWMKCSVCGAIAEDSRETHGFDNACDTDCNTCGQVRTITHNYSAQDKSETEHWMKCSVCGVIDEPTRETHIYDNACDVDCNVCGQVRTITHDYSVQDKDATNHWMKCSVCGTVDESTRTAHVYDNTCEDVDCNVCGAVRQVFGHTYDNACDADCNECGKDRIPSDHVYDSVCDVDCNVCGEDRTPPHDYTVQDMDETNHWMKCSLCAAVDESTRASHVYDNPCEDSDCNGCTFKRIPPHAYDSDADFDCNLCSLQRPVAPVAQSVVGTTVTLETVEGCEYSTDGFIWQASPVFEDLEPVTTYTFYQRYAETDAFYAGSCSLGTEITTQKGTPSAPAAPTAEEITKTSVTLVKEEGMQYSSDGTTWKDDPVFTGLRRGGIYTFYARYAETSTHYASPASVALEVQTLKDPLPAPKSPALAEVSGRWVTLVAVEGLEYSMDGETWQSDAVFRGLTPDTEYTFYQRQAEKDEYYASPASAPLVVKTLSVILGDLDGNPGVDMDDAIYLLFYTSFPEDYPVNQPVNFDGIGEVDMDDAIYLLFYTSFPEDYPLN